MCHDIGGAVLAPLLWNMRAAGQFRAALINKTDIYLRNEYMGKKEQWVNDFACDLCAGKKHHTCTGYECHDAVEVAGKCYESKKKRNGWISAAKPPKHSRDVLICYENEAQEVAFYEGGRWWRGKFFTDIIDTADVAAWRPLPVPYKKCEEKEADDSEWLERQAY